MKFVTVCILSAVAASAACGSSTAGSDLVELQRQRAGDVDVVLLSEDGKMSHGRDSFTVEFRRGDALVDVGTVKAGATMPMAGMAPMMGSVFLEPGDMPGRYKAETDLSMSGGWNLTLDWNGPAGRGTAKFAATAE